MIIAPAVLPTQVPAGKEGQWTGELIPSSFCFQGRWEAATAKVTLSLPLDSEAAKGHAGSLFSTGSHLRPAIHEHHRRG